MNDALNTQTVSISLFFELKFAGLEQQGFVVKAARVFQNLQGLLEFFRF